MADSYDYEDPKLASIGAEVAEKAKTFGDGLDPSMLPDASTQPEFNPDEIKEQLSYEGEGGTDAPPTNQTEDETVASLGSDLQTKAVVSETPATTEYSDAPESLPPTSDYTEAAVASVDSSETSLAEIGDEVAEKAKSFGDGLDSSTLPDPETQPDYNPEEVKDALTPEY